MEFRNGSFGPGCLSLEMRTVVSGSIMQDVWSIRRSSLKTGLKNTLLPVSWESVRSFLVYSYQNKQRPR